MDCNLILIWLRQLHREKVDYTIPVIINTKTILIEY